MMAVVDIPGERDKEEGTVELEETDAGFDELVMEELLTLEVASGGNTENV